MRTREMLPERRTAMLQSTNRLPVTFTSLAPDWVSVANAGMLRTVTRSRAQSTDPDENVMPRVVTPPLPSMVRFSIRKLELEPVLIHVELLPDLRMMVPSRSAPLNALIADTSAAGGARRRW